MGRDLQREPIGTLLDKLPSQLLAKLSLILIQVVVEVNLKLLSRILVLHQ
jgi:hypothetical protein